MIKEGAMLPRVRVARSGPSDVVDVRELFAGKTGVLIGVLGAFTPTCSHTHLPGFISGHRALQKKGVQLIACISVNDPYVMQAWAQSLGTEGKIEMLSDVRGEFGRATGLELEAPASLGNTRLRRFVMLLENGRIARLSVEPDSWLAHDTLCSATLNWL